MFTSNLIAGIIGIALVCIFLGVLLWWIKALPITIIMVGAVGLMIYDFVTSLRAGNGVSST